MSKKPNNEAAIISHEYWKFIPGIGMIYFRYLDGYEPTEKQVQWVSELASRKQHEEKEAQRIREEIGRSYQEYERTELEDEKNAIRDFFLLDE